MNSKEKLQLLKGFLKRNGLVFYEKFNGKMKTCAPDLYIPKHRIMVKVSDEHDQPFYNEVKFRYHPLFIRETESGEFTLEKLQNLIIEIMKRKQVLHNRTIYKSKRVYGRAY